MSKNQNKIDPVVIISAGIIVLVIAMVMVMFAGMHSGAASPLSQSMPEGQSTASTIGGTVLEVIVDLINSMYRAKSDLRGKRKPVPKIPSSKIAF